MKCRLNQIVMKRIGEKVEASRTRGATRLAMVVIIITAILVAAAFGSYLALTQKKASSLVTCTGIPAISYLYCPSPLRISAYGEPGASPISGSSNEGSGILR